MPLTNYVAQLEDMQKTLRHLIIATLVLYIVVATVSVLGYISSSHRIDDIQASRVTSCVRTYDSIGEVFRQFIPPPPRTAQQQADVDKFNKTINHLKAKCVVQTKP